MRTWVGWKWVLFSDNPDLQTEHEVWFYRLPISEMRLYKAGELDIPVCKWISYS